jgi:hypothetical protein
MGSGKTQEPMAILVPSKGFVKVLGLNIAPNSRKSPINTNKSGRIYGKNRGLFLLKPFDKVSRWNIWDVTPIKSPLVTRIKSIDGQNVITKITEYRCKR